MRTGAAREERATKPAGLRAAARRGAILSGQTAQLIEPTVHGLSRQNVRFFCASPKTRRLEETLRTLTREKRDPPDSAKRRSETIVLDKLLLTGIRFRIPRKRLSSLKDCPSLTKSIRNVDSKPDVLSSWRSVS
jgi:hypothetical protein